jgi:superfamily I DNA/RNA helicase
MAQFIPSERQAEFFNFVAYGKGSCNLISVAGSGKSTSILQSFAYIHPNAKVLYLVFNTRNAKEMNVKLKGLEVELNRSFRNVYVSTFHAYGFSALRYYFKSRGIVCKGPDDHKCRNLFKAMVSEEQYILYNQFVMKLVGLAKGAGIGVVVKEGIEEAYYALIEHHDMELESEHATVEQAIVYARQVMKASFEAVKVGQIDFDDMLFAPLALNLSFFKQDHIFVDEYQDTNPVRREIVKRSLNNHNSRVYGVGDPKQAIYGFTGASNDAMDIAAREFNACTMYLNVSYRCPKAIVDSVKKIVPYFEVHEQNIEGDEFDVNFKEMLECVTAKDAILCRNVAPIVRLAFKIIAKGRACHVLGSEIGKGLVSLVNKMQAHDIPELRGALIGWAERESDRLIQEKKEEKAAAVMDRVECVLVMIDSLPEKANTIQGLIARIEALFQDEENTLCLSSIHKAKGREWENVVIYRRDLMPSPWAKKAWAREQEQNLEYVARTRATNYLMFLAEVIE